MSNYECPHCGMTNIDCGWGKFKTPREIELEARVKEIEEYIKDPCEYCQPTSKCRECLGEGILDIINKAKNC